jgi:hypothetical protein
MDVVVVENIKNTLSAITPEITQKSVRHVHNPKAQRKYLHDTVANSHLDIK